MKKAMPDHLSFTSKRVLLDINRPKTMSTSAKYEYSKIWLNIESTF